MSSRGARVRCLICGALAGLLVGYALQRGDRWHRSGYAHPGFLPADALDGFSGLDKPVTLSETKIPLGELIQKVAATTGVPLKVALEVADEPVAVVVTAYPARELLRQTADLLDFQWRRKQTGEEVCCEISQDAASRQRAEALKSAALDAALRRLQSAIHRTVELATLSPEQLALLAAPRSGQPQPGAWSLEPGAASIARGLVASPVSQILGRFLGTLPASHWKRLLRDGRPLVFSTDPAPGELGLPASIGRSLRGLRPRRFEPGARVVAGSPEVEQRLREREKEIGDAWMEAPGYRVTLRTNSRTSLRGDSPFRLMVQASPLGGIPGNGARESGGGWGTSLTIEGSPVEAELLPGEPTHDPLPGVPKHLSLEGAAARTAPDGRTQRPERLTDLLPFLARAYGVQFLSDAYDSSPRLPARPSGDATTLGALLWRLAGATHAWDRQGSLVRLRSRSWAFDRPREVPYRLLRRWQRLCDARGALPFEEWTLAVAGLNEGQLQTLADVARERDLPPEFQTARAAWPSLRLYASLPPEQQQALARGEEILAAAMGPRQRELFLAAAGNGDPPGSPAATVEPGAGFSLARASFTRTRERQGKGARHRVTRVTLHCRIAPGVLRSAALVEAEPADHQQSAQSKS